MTLFKCIVLSFIQISYAENRTCNELLDILEKKNSLSLPGLQTMQRKDIITCLVHLGKGPLRSAEADYIWQSIKHNYGDVANIPESVLAALQWVTPAIPAEDYYNITFANIDVIKNFGQDYQLNDKQLRAIADRVRNDFKEPVDFTSYDLVALNQILCAFNGSEVERIHPKAYKAAFVVIGELKRCSSEVLREFAKLATDNSAFGSSEHWDSSVLDSIGVLREFFPKKIQDKIKKAKGEQENKEALTI